jgi:hypothetical protein
MWGELQLAASLSSLGRVEVQDRGGLKPAGS